MKTMLRLAAVALLGALGIAARHAVAPRPVTGHRVARAPRGMPPSMFWNSATVYFLLTDRFLDADTGNDHALGRAHDGGVLRSFEGGDFKGVTERIAAGYFDSLGVNVLWLTPFVEQVRGKVDEGWGETYAYHGYWGRDWTAVDPAFGTKDDLRALVDSAHAHHIRVLMDAVINHVGPVTPQDPPWPDDWVRSGPNCTNRSYATTVDCNLVATLPDLRTESNAPVDLPPWLVDKWRSEGRLDQERASLESFFTRSGYPRAPRYYFIKWLTDWVREFGFDGYRMDTAKHFGESVSLELKKEADRAFADWKEAHPSEVLDSLPFYMVGEVYGWDPSQGRRYSYGDSSVNFFASGYDALINFAFKRDAAGSMDSLDARLSDALHGGDLTGYAILNYVSSHDDGQPYDLDRRDPFGAANRLLLAPGGAQIYYGDELARPLRVAGARGDANLRSDMNWGDLASDSSRRILEHWRKLGMFRLEHPAVGAGVHRTLQVKPYVFSRSLETDEVEDRVLVALDEPAGPKTIRVFNTFPDGTRLTDSYSGARGTVGHGTVTIRSDYPVVLLSAGAEAAGAGRGDVVLVVTNNYVMPVAVFARGAGTDYQVGTVLPGIEGRFIIRKAMLGSGTVEFLGNPADGARQISSGGLLLRPGDVVRFVITTHLIGSYADVSHR